MSKGQCLYVAFSTVCVFVCVAHLLAYTVLVDGPDGWHVGGKQLILCEGGIAGSGAD